MTFASIETAINAATVAALTNATLTWGASSSASVVFRNGRRRTRACWRSGTNDGIYRML